MIKTLLIGALAALVSVYYTMPATAVVTNQATQTVSALGNNTTTNYSIGFDFRDNSQLVVQLTDSSYTPAITTTLTYGSGPSQYLLTSGNPSTTVVMGTPPTTTQFVTITRSLPFVQPVVYQAGLPFPVSAHGTQMDEQVMMIQGLNATINSAILGTSNAVTASSPLTASSPNPSQNIAFQQVAAGLVLAGPSPAPSASPAAPTFRSLVASDLPLVAVTVQTFPSPNPSASPQVYTLPTSPRKPLWLEIKMVGGGGGGGGGGSAASGGTGSTGVSSTFGNSLLIANGGTGGSQWGGAGQGTGGTASLGSASGIALTGANGQVCSNCSLSVCAGAIGGSSPFGGVGSVGAGLTSILPTNSAANTGSGGSGAGSGAYASYTPGFGGGASGFVNAIITNPAASYLVTTGAGGAGGFAGTSGSAGGAGGSGIIIVVEHYQ